MSDPVVAPAPTGLAGAELFSGGGRMGELMAATDWARTPLGIVEEWPASLRTSLDICLRSRFPILVWWGSDLVMLYNDAYRPMLGQSKHPRALGAPGREIWPEIWPIIGPMLDGVLKGRGATWSDNQLLLLHRNDYLEECYFTFSYSPIKGEDGAVGGVFTAVQETTEQVVGERRLRALRALGDEAGLTGTPTEACRRTAAILDEHLRDVPFALIYLIEQDGTARLAGRAGIGANHPGAVDAFHLDDPAAPWPLGAVAAAAEPVLMALSEPRRFPAGDWDGAAERAYLLPLAAPARDGAAGVLVAGLSPRRAFDQPYADFLQLVAGHIATAIANATAYEAERARAEALAELDRAKTVFFANVSHEFRTPLTLSLAPLADALNDDADPLSAPHRERIEIAHRNSLRLLKLVNTLLDFSRIEAGRAQAAFEPTDLSRLTADLASTFRSTIERAGLEYRVECQALDQPVYVDHDMWEKIVLNLLSNAYKFTLQGMIRVSIHPTPTHAVLTVSDSGTGIAPAELPRLFERFHRVRNSRGRSVEGTGIGLALVKELVRLHDGQIEVDSEEDAGTTFRVSVPFGKAHVGGLPAVAARERSTTLGAAPFIQEALRWSGDTAWDHFEPAFATPPGGLPAQPTPPGRILLADDNADMRAYVERLLGTRWPVEAVGDGRSALARAQASTPALVISDVMMPGLSGVELLTALRADPRTRAVPVILLSARAGEEARLQGLAAGADDYLVKPFGARELIARVDATLALARLRADSSVALQASETRYRSLAEASAQVIWSADPAGSFNAPSRSWEAYTGQCWEEYRAFGFVEAIHPDDRQRTLAIWEDCLKRQEPCVAEYRLRRTDGQYRHVLARGVPVRNSGGWVTEWVGTVTDVDDQRSAETRLRQAAKMEAIGRLAGGLAHDFNNQLQAVAGFATFIEREEDLGPGAQADLEQIKKAAERMASLTRQLLAFSRQQLLTPETLELAAAVAEARPLLQRLIGPLVDFQVRAPVEPVWVRVDRAQLLQVLMNLTINSRDAMPEGGLLEITVDSEIVTAPRGCEGGIVLPGVYGRLSVRDNGSGVSPEHLPHIFEPFFTTKRIGEGTGLGLATVHGIVAQSHGYVTVSSRPAQGTEFVILLPLAEPPASRSAAGASQREPAGPGLRILAADDEAPIREVMRRTLEDAGYEVLLAEDGPGVLDVLDREPGGVDLLLCDVAMPSMSGSALATALAERYPDLPVVWVSGYPRETAFRGGGRSPQPFLQKPVDAEELLAVIRRAVHRS
jgi:PAS domain S-box-containing protein